MFFIPGTFVPGIAFIQGTFVPGNYFVVCLQMMELESAAPVPAVGSEVGSPRFKGFTFVPMGFFRGGVRSVEIRRELGGHVCISTVAIVPTTRLYPFASAIFPSDRKKLQVLGPQKVTASVSQSDTTHQKVRSIYQIQLQPFGSMGQ